MTFQRILITGGCGFIGSNLVLELLKAGYRDITVLDTNLRSRWCPAALSGGRVDLVQMDIRSKELEGLLRSRGITTVLHLAAIHYIPQCDKNPTETWSVNVDGTQAVLDACLEARIKHFFMASTAAVYKSSPQAHVEEDPLEPIDVYGRTKLRNEEQVRAAVDQNGLKFAIGRIFNVVGAYESNPHLIPAIIERLKKSRRIEIGNIAPKRDYIHACDVSRAIIRMTFGSEQPIDVCNIGTGMAYSAPEIISLLADIIGERIDYVSSLKFQRQVDRPMLCADFGRIHRRYGWQPVYSLKQALADALAYQSKSGIPLEDSEALKTPSKISGFVSLSKNQHG